ncbi:hypothetical protein [Sorangium sp. So ce1182]|uniref:hypothetical protein n=1 Tax=Sorangium sp. So ce1182 TaxID=3133334 RepID=UPI003F5E744E
MRLVELHQEELHCKLASTDERHLTLNELHQWMTYAGLLEGIPDREMNDWCIEQHVQRAACYGSPGSRTTLIQPARRDFLRRPGDMEPMKRHGLHEDPEWLPVVMCVGIFRHVPPTRSHLVVVWYQDEFAFPLDGGVLSQLRAITLDATGSSLSGSERVT